MVCADQCPLLLPIKGTQLGLTVAEVGTTAAGRKLRVQTVTESPSPSGTHETVNIHQHRNSVLPSLGNLSPPLSGPAETTAGTPAAEKYPKKGEYF